MANLGIQLCCSAKEGNIERVRDLLDQGVTVDSRDVGEFVNQYTPLIWASKEGHLAVATLLLDRGANVNAETACKNTAAIEVCWRGHLDILQLLVSRGANIHHRDYNNWSPLLAAAMTDQFSVCKYLLSLGADLMAATNYNTSVLDHYGRNSRTGFTIEMRPLRCAVLKEWWEKGPHPSQIKRRSDKRWAKCGPFITVLAENGYRPLQARALEIALSALSLDPNEPVILPRTPLGDVFRNDDLVRYIVEFL